MLNSVGLRGVPGVHRVFLLKHDKAHVSDEGSIKTKEWASETDGVNLKVVMRVPGVDCTRTYSSSCVGIFNILRILSFDEHPVAPIVKHQKLQPSDLSTRSSADDQFTAVHVSGDGKDIVALTVCGVLIVIPGFQRLISGEAVLSNIAIQLHFPPNIGHIQDTAIYLALSEKDGKVAAAMCRGLYLVSPDIECSHLTTECPPRPGVVVSHLTDPTTMWVNLHATSQVTHTCPEVFRQFGVLDMLWCLGGIPCGLEAAFCRPQVEVIEDESFLLMDLAFSGSDEMVA